MIRAALTHLGLAAALAAVCGQAVFAASSERRRASSAPAGTAPSAPAAAAPAAAPGSFEAFQLIVERNIFNPNRVGRTRVVVEEAPPRVDEIALVGTLLTDTDRMAFFDSPDSAYRKSLREGDTIGDFKVTRIAADGVELQREDQKLPLKVAQQLRRPEGGTWSVRTAPAADSRAGASPGLSRSDEAAPPEIPDDASEVLKRLMKKRELQLKK